MYRSSAARTLDRARCRSTLNHFLGDALIAHEQSPEPEERAVVAIDNRRERALIPREQLLDEREIDGRRPCTRVQLCHGHRLSF